MCSVFRRFKLTSSVTITHTDWRRHASSSTNRVRRHRLRHRHPWRRSPQVARGGQRFCSFRDRRVHRSVKVMRRLPRPVRLPPPHRHQASKAIPSRAHRSGCDYLDEGVGGEVQCLKSRGWFAQFRCDRWGQAHRPKEHSKPIKASESRSSGKVTAIPRSPFNLHPGLSKNFGGRSKVLATFATVGTHSLAAPFECARGGRTRGATLTLDHIDPSPTFALGIAK